MAKKAVNWACVTDDATAGRRKGWERRMLMRPIGLHPPSRPTPLAQESSTSECP